MTILHFDLNGRMWFLALALSLFGSDGFAQGNAKVQVCHAPPDDPSNFQTISVTEKALPAHLAHGDTSGSCDAACDPSAGECQDDLCASVICEPIDQCHTAGECMVVGDKAICGEGVPMPDGSECVLQSTVLTSGICLGGSCVECAPPESSCSSEVPCCFEGTFCDTQIGVCVFPNEIE